MSKAVMISIQPQWCEKIAARWKSLELRKSKPNIPLPFKCYIYQTRLKWVFNLLRMLEMDDIADTLTIGFGKVIGEFVCDHILGHCEMGNADLAEQQSYVRRADIFKYSGGKEVFGWHISDLVIYEEPKALGEFHFPPDRYCKRNLCGGCPYDEIPDVNGEYRYDCNWERPLLNPPQSWCYVEELGI